MTASALAAAIALLAWGVVAYKLPSLRRHPEDPVHRFYWLTLLLVALAMTALLPPIYLAVDRASRVPNLARLLADGCGMAASWAAQALLFHLNFAPEPARARTRGVGLALALALLALAACFALAPLREEAIDFTARYARAPFVFEYRLIFLAFLGAGMGNAARLYRRYADLASRPTLRLGLRLAALAAGLGLCYVANELLRVGSARFNFPDPVPSAGAVSQSLLATFVAVGLISALLPAWGERLGILAVARWLKRYHSLRRLYRLWAALYAANPAIALDPPASRLADVLTWRHLDFRLYRRVVEIRDGWLLLRPYMDPRAADHARRLVAVTRRRDGDREAVIEAATLAAALQAHRRRQGPAEGDAWAEPSGGATLGSEVTALERVARYYRRSPIVQTVVRCMEANWGDVPQEERATR